MMQAVKTPYADPYFIILVVIVFHDGRCRKVHL
jgi:hypothetical protein